MISSGEEPHAGPGRTAGHARGSQGSERRPHAGVTANGRRRHGVLVAVFITLSLVVAACSGGAAGRPRALVSPGGSSSSSTTAPTPGVRPPPPTASASPTTGAPTDQPGWTTVSAGVLAAAVDERTVAGADGSQITVVRFHAGQVRFALHVGSQDPPVGQGVIGPDAGSQVSASERPVLLGAFNGGFKVASGSGGFEVDNLVVRPLVPGLASFVIDTDGSGHVGVWGHDVPAPGEHVLSVRQNLPPLITDGVLSPQITVVGAWGSTFGHLAAVARAARWAWTAEETSSTRRAWPPCPSTWATRSSPPAP